MQGPVPRQHPVQYGIQALVINLLVAQMLSLRRRARAGDIKLSEASAMLSRCVMGGGCRGAPPATPDVDDFGSTASGFMSSGRASSHTASAGKRSVRATRASWASYMGQCSHQRQPPAARTDLCRRGYRATDEEPAPCHKVNKSASKTLNDAGRKRYRTIRAPGNCPTSRRKENVDANAHNLHERLVKHENLRFIDNHRGREPGYPPHRTGRALFAPPLTTRRWFGHGLSGQR